MRLERDKDQSRRWQAGATDDVSNDERRSFGDGCARWAPWVIVGGALLLRIGYVAETSGVPTIRHLVGDAAGYASWGARIAEGDWWGLEAFYQAPLYPYFLALCHVIGGPSVWVIRLAQALLGAMGVGCLYLGVRAFLGSRVACVAAVMLALYGPGLFFDGIVQKAALGSLLICALLAAMGWASKSRYLSRTIIVGVVSALLVLTRENALVWLVILMGWLAVTWRGGKRSDSARGVGGFLLGACIVLVPVGARNVAVSGEWSISTFQAGPNFYIGNHLGATGRYVPLVRGHETPEFERADATALAEQALRRTLSSREVSMYWMDRALSDIRSDPGSWLGLLGKKVALVWNRYEIFDAEAMCVYSAHSVSLGVLASVWHFGVLCPLAAVGFVSTWSQRERLWVLYALIISMAVAVAAFYVMARYRYPLVPLLIPFAAAGCVELWQLVARRDVRCVLRRVALAGVVAIGVNWPILDEDRLDAMGWMNAGVASAQQGELGEATTYFRLAVERHPTSAEANNNLGQALAVQGDFAEAVMHYRATLAADPTLMGVDYNLAVALERVGRIEEALSHYERAFALDPSDSQAEAAMARLRVR